MLLANAIAWPIAWWFMANWLDGFAYRVELSWLPFALAGGGALIIAVATTGFHALKVAKSRPVLALRYE
ncbi:MAG: putative transport system permease protein [Aliidongia sp.]|nr:putative transport system permease protein [Aliidongia sp.]